MQTDQSDRPSCPRCGVRGKRVKPITIESLVDATARARAGRADGFLYCGNSNCDVAYFHSMTDALILTREVRVRIGQKETAPPRTICYCFDHTVEDIEHEVLTSGTSRTAEDIAAKCRAGLDRCEETNPQGSCCLGNVRQVVQETAERRDRAIGGTGSRLLHAVGAAPGALMSLLPVAACPACLPAYAGFLSALGLGFLSTARVMNPLLIVFLIAGIVSMAWSSRKHRMKMPLILTVIGSVAVILGRLLWDSPPLLYTGGILVITGSIWNFRASKVERNSVAACPCGQSGGRECA